MIAEFERIIRFAIILCSGACGKTVIVTISARLSAPGEGGFLHS
jgi:hypothetical protein